MKSIELLLLALLIITCSSEVVQAEEFVQRIGLIGCHRQDTPAPAMWRYVQAEPDLMLWLGDNVYVDSEHDMNVLKSGHEMLAALPAFQAIRATTPFAVIWDDHDYGLNNSGRHYALKDQSKNFFRRFWGMDHHIPADRDGIYHSRYFGTGDTRLQLLLLDGRFNRDDEGENTDTLGENQWQWLASELKKPARLRLIVSGYQFFLDRETKFETWSKFPRAQQKLLELIRASDAEGVVFIAGDQHYGEVSRVPAAIGYDAIELMFCGINQEEPHVYNSHRVSPVAHAKNAYALVDIQWHKNESDEPHFVFRVFDADRDAVELSYRVNFDELQLLRQTQ